MPSVPWLQAAGRAFKIHVSFRNGALFNLRRGRGPFLANAVADGNEKTLRQKEYHSRVFPEWCRFSICAEDVGPSLQMP